MEEKRTEIRPGLGGIVDYVDIVEDVKRKIRPIMSLMICAAEINPLAGNILTNTEVSNLGEGIREKLDEVFNAVDGIYDVLQREVKNMERTKK